MLARDSKPERQVSTKTEPYSSSPAERRPPILSIDQARRSYFSTSVGTKVLIAATGLVLLLYLVLHLIGNLLVFLGPATFNGYSHLLIKNPLIVPVEIGLAAIFLLHIFKAITNWQANRRARPVGYYQSNARMFGWGWAGKPSRKSIASSTMIFSGLITLFFVVVHLRQFRFGAEYVVADGANAAMVRDLYRLEYEIFGNAINVAFYAICMVVIGGHLWHGISSAFTSLGIEHRLWVPVILTVGRVLAILLAAGFLLIPVVIFALGGR